MAALDGVQLVHDVLDAPTDGVFAQKLVQRMGSVVGYRRSVAVIHSCELLRTLATYRSYTAALSRIPACRKAMAMSMSSSLRGS